MATNRRIAPAARVGKSPVALDRSVDEGRVQIDTLAVSLTDGPVTERFAKKSSVASRTIYDFG
jgi:hypothetical protein